MHIGGHLFSAESCGQPGQVSEVVHPAAVAALQDARIPLLVTEPRSWDELRRANLHRLDFVVTMDERTLSGQPVWPGQPVSALWSFDDVAALDDPERARLATVQMLFVLQRRLELLVNLALHAPDPAAIRSDLRDLGRM